MRHISSFIPHSLTLLNLKSMKMHFMQLWLLGILFKTQPEVTLPEENYRDEF